MLQHSHLSTGKQIKTESENKTLVQNSNKKHLSRIQPYLLAFDFPRTVINDEFNVGCLIFFALLLARKDQNTIYTLKYANLPPGQPASCGLHRAPERLCMSAHKRIGASASHIKGKTAFSASFAHKNVNLANGNWDHWLAALAALAALVWRLVLRIRSIKSCALLIRIAVSSAASKIRIRH
jgi:hypothetical protein